MDDDNNLPEPILPVIRQPTGKAYYFGTWSGRLLLANIFIFLMMVAIQPSAFLFPNIEFIRDFGSKSMADIARGEYWRFITPMFVHIGVIHIFFNGMGLYYVGYQIEAMLGPRWFMTVYMLSGIIGNLSSCLFSIAPSAGASGAIFGLLGAGFRLEYLVNKSLVKSGLQPTSRKKIYRGMVLTNVVIGFLIPVIDNAAHLGGLLTGWLIVEAMLRTKPNRLLSTNPKITKAIFLLLFVFSLVVIAMSIDKSRAVNRFYIAAEKSSSIADAYDYLSEAIRIKPLDGHARLFRARLLLQAGETDAGLNDVKIALGTFKRDSIEIKTLINDLQMTGHSVEAELVRRMEQEIN